MCPNNQHRFGVANLAQRGKRVRLWIGIVGSAATTGAALFMVLDGVHPLWRWSLLFPAFVSILCLLEAFTSTCVVLAALGAWDLGCGTERVPDRDLDNTLKFRACKLVIVAALAAFALTLSISL